MLLKNFDDNNDYFKDIIDKYNLKNLALYNLTTQKALFYKELLIPSLKLITFINEILTNFPYQDKNKEIQECGNCCETSYCFSTIISSNCFFFFIPSHEELIQPVRRTLISKYC